LKKLLEEFEIKDKKIKKIMAALESRCVPDPELEFGKHKGKKISEVYQTHPGYVKWLLQAEDMSERRPELYEAAVRLTKKRKLDE
jgi:hypothetical protein